MFWKKKSKVSAKPEESLSTDIRTFKPKIEALERAVWAVMDDIPRHERRGYDGTPIEELHATLNRVSELLVQARRLTNTKEET